MHFQLLTVAAALTGLSAAAPGNGWGDYNSWGGWQPVSSSSSASSTSSSSVKTSSSTSYPVRPTTSSSSSSSFSFPGKTTTSSASVVYTTSSAVKSTTSSFSFPGKTTTSSASVIYTTSSAVKSITSSFSFPGKPSTSTCGTSTVTITTGSTCATGGVSTVTVTATPSCSGPTFPTPSSCYLTDDKANQIIATYDTLINRNIHGAEFNATADALLSNSYVLTSNSINADEGLPLNTVTIPNKQVFISLFWNIPQGNGETTLDIFHSCNKISWRWTGTNPDGELVRGITDMEITSAGQIGPVFSEYLNPTLDRCSTTTSK